MQIALVLFWPPLALSTMWTRPHVGRGLNTWRSEVVALVRAVLQETIDAA